MTSAFDQRIVRVGLEFESETLTFEGLAIYASGVKYGSAMFNECECRIFNLTRDQRNYILTKASPLVQALNGQGNNTPRTPINMTLDVGRESYGTFRLFEGNVISCNVTQPPDIGITLRSLTCNFFTGTILGGNQSAIADLKTICQQVADSMNLSLDFQATNKNIDNYNFNGATVKQVDKLNQLGGIVAHIDNKTLLVIDAAKTKEGETRLISAQTGMIGIPQVTEQGVLVRMMLDNSIELSRAVKIESEINPAANGTYKVVKINFEVANRDQQFWYALECSNLPYYQGTL